MKFKIYLILFLIAFTPLHSLCDNAKNQKLLEECSAALEKRDFHKTNELANTLFKTASKGDDKKFLGYANYYLGTANLFLGNSKVSKAFLNEAREIAQANQNDSLMGNVLSTMAIYEANVNTNYYKAQHYLMDCVNYPGMEANAYSNLAQLARLQRDTSGMEYARKGYEYGLRHNDRHYIYSGLINMTEFHILKEEYDKARISLTEAKKIAQKYNYKDQGRLSFLEAMVMSHEGHPAESNKILLDILPSIRDNQPIYLPELLYVVGKNYELQHDYSESNKWLLESLQASKELESNVYVGEVNKLIAENYRSMGLPDKAFEYMLSAFEVEKHVADTERKRMNNERKLTLESIHREQKLQLAEQASRNRTTIIIILSLLLTLAIAAIFYVIINLRKKKRLYERIVKRNLEILEEEKVYRNRIVELEGELQNIQEKNRSAAASREAKSRTLFIALQNLMENEALYRNAQLTREDLIDRLETNSTYLTQAIKDNTSMNYAQYINSFRIREAIIILSDKKYASTPIKEIAEMVGCNSLTTFYKLFQQATGISPSAFRKSAINT